MKKELQIDNKSDSSKDSQSFNLSTAHSQAPFQQKTIQRKPENRTFQRRKRLTQKHYKKEDSIYISPQDDRHNNNEQEQNGIQQCKSIVLGTNYVKKQQLHYNSIKNLSRISIGPVRLSMMLQDVKKVQNDEIVKQEKSNEKQQSLPAKSDITQSKKLKQDNERLIKKVDRLTSQLNRVKLQNIQMKNKILTYQQQIHKLKKQQQSLARLLIKQQNHKKAKSQLSQYLQQIILKLNQKIESLVFQNQKLINQKCQILDDFSQTIGKNQQVHKSILQIQTKIKYLQAENYVLKKKTFESEQNQEKVKILIQKNIKLQAKIDQFHKFRKNILDQQNYRNKSNKNSAQQILFFLSPQN